MELPSKIKVKLGQVLLTLGAQDALQASGQSPWAFLARHPNGDSGDVDDEDKRLNDEAVRDGSRIWSAYATEKGARLWIITEGSRAATTILLPDEY